jgi:hypothetical protein
LLAGLTLSSVLKFVLGIVPVVSAIRIFRNPREAPRDRETSGVWISTGAGKNYDIPSPVGVN